MAQSVILWIVCVQVVGSVREAGSSSLPGPKLNVSDI